MSSLRNYETVDAGKFILVSPGREIINATRSDPLELAKTLSDLEDELNAHFVCIVPSVFPTFLMRKIDPSVWKAVAEETS